MGKDALFPQRLRENIGGDRHDSKAVHLPGNQVQQTGIRNHPLTSGCLLADVYQGEVCRRTDPGKLRRRSGLFIIEVTDFLQILPLSVAVAEA